jgi:UPF0716 protein FxsA
MNKLRYLFLIIPLLELVIFIELGSDIGSLNVIFLIFLTIFLGIYLIKSNLRNIKLSIFDIRNLENMHQRYTANVYSLIAGILLIIPGFLTDSLGLLLLLPIFRSQISKYFKNDNRTRNKNSNKNNIIDGDYRNDE